MLMDISGLVSLVLVKGVRREGGVGFLIRDCLVSGVHTYGRV